MEHGIYVEVGHREDWWAALREAGHSEAAADRKQMTSWSSGDVGVGRKMAILSGHTKRASCAPLRINHRTSDGRPCRSIIGQSYMLFILCFASFPDMPTEMTLLFLHLRLLLQQLKSQSVIRRGRGVSVIYVDDTDLQSNKTPSTVTLDISQSHPAGSHSGH